MKNNPDLIVGHPFQGTGRWGDICEHEDGQGWICGYSRAEHADQGDAEVSAMDTSEGADE